MYVKINFPTQAVFSITAWIPAGLIWTDHGGIQHILKQPHCQHLWAPDKRKDLFAGQYAEKDLFFIFFPASIFFLYCHPIYNLMKNNYLL